MKKKKITVKEYPIIKPEKPRTINTLQRFTILCDPDGGHGDGSEAFEITLAITPADQPRLRNYVNNDSAGFMHDLNYQLIQRIYTLERDFPKYYGTHAKTHAIEGAIKTVATKVYVITNFWLSQPEKKRPPLFNKFVEMITEKQDDEQYFVHYDKNDEFNAQKITHVAILESYLGRLGLKYGLKLFRTDKENIIYLKTPSFFKSYVSNEFVKQLEGLFADQKDKKERYQFATHWLTVWLKYLNYKEERWIKSLNLQNL